MNSLDEKMAKEYNEKASTFEKQYKKSNDNHRSSGSRRNSSSSKSKLKQKTKHRKKLMVNSLLVLALLIAVALLLKLAPKRAEEKKPVVDGISEQSVAEDYQIKVSLPIFDDEVFLIGDAALALYNAGENVHASDVLSKYNEDGERLDVGAPVRLSFEIDSLPDSCSVASAKVEVSEDSSFFNSRIFELKDDYSVDFFYLKTGTEYHYRITLRLSNGKEASFQSTFQTAATPRILSIDGARNVRDIGGWETVDGRRIKQGLLYRGTEIDGAVVPEYKITDKGRQDMLTVLGIRTDMDLRHSADNESGVDALGANVKHIYYNAPMYDGAFSIENQGTMRSIFSDLSKDDAYPVFLHCTYGTDRTGTVCYLLEALLGLSDEDLVREYEFTGLYNPSIDGKNVESISKALDAYEGTTTQEKVENYLLSIGISEQEIESIRNIFLEK